MRCLAASACVLLALGGCVGTGDVPDASDDVGPVIQEATESGLETVDSLVGLRVADDHKSLTYDFLEGMHLDSVQMLAVQFLEEGEYSYRDVRDLRITSPPPGSEQRDVDSVCKFDIDWTKAPVDYFIARAGGQEVAFPHNATFGGTAGYGIGASGSSSAQGSGNGHADEGDWLLVFAGLAGYDPGIASQDGHWTLEVGSVGPLRVVKLPSPQFSCGVGFRPMPGSAVGPDPVPLYEAGELTVEGLYGGTFGFCPSYGDVVANPLGPQSNQASVDFMGNRTDLSPLLKTHLEGARNAPMTLTVEQWAGEPLWAMVGLYLPAVTLAWFPC